MSAFPYARFHDFPTTIAEPFFRTSFLVSRTNTTNKRPQQTNKQTNKQLTKQTNRQTNHLKMNNSLNSIDSQNWNASLRADQVDPLSLSMRLPVNVGALSPPPRLPLSFLPGVGVGGRSSGIPMANTITNTNTVGMDESLHMLCDVAVGGDRRLGTKRRERDENFYGPEVTKRRKTDDKKTGVTTKPKISHDDMIQRLCSLGGGFPMPKWRGGNVKKPSPSSGQRHPSVSTLSRLGSFPLPPLKDVESPFLTIPSLSSYQRLWQKSAPELRKEMLARQLYFGNAKM